MTNARWAKAGFGEHRAIMTASDVGESSKENLQWGGGHGVFTYYLLEGLKGAADANHDHQITVGELFDYVSRQVSKQTDGSQHPQKLAGSERQIVLTGDHARRASLEGHQFFAGGVPK
jgi:hypothetical protein